MPIKTIENIQEPEYSSMFLNNISVVDHAYIDNKGCIRGGSFNPNFIVSGKPDPTEKVVVDFSTIKKDIKKYIDQHIWDIYENGFDHKLWIIEDYSTYNSFEIVETRTTKRKGTNKQWALLKTPTIEISLPIDAIRFISKDDENEIPKYDLNYIGKKFEQHVKKYLSQQYPNIEIDVQCINTFDEHKTFSNAQSFTFHYVHGLKDSTSYGCQNIAHGHRSFIHADKANILGNTFLEEIAKELDNTVFIRAENIISTEEDWLTIGYKTPLRGKFHMKINTEAHKVIVLPTETTIEFIVNFIKTHYGEKNFKRGGISSLFVSEGLTKGSLVNFE